MSLRLAFGLSEEFWGIEVRDSTTTVRFGRIGSPGQTVTSSHANETEARTSAERLIAEKRKRGYVDAPRMAGPRRRPAFGTGPIALFPARIVESERRADEERRRRAEENSGELATAGADARLRHITVHERVPLPENRFRSVVSASGALGVPENIGVLGATLTTLSLHAPSSFPESLGRLGKLSRLSIRGPSHEMLVVPDVIARLTSLERLEIAGYDRAAMPAALDRAARLSSIDFERTSLASGKDLTAVAQAPALVELRCTPHGQDVSALVSAPKLRRLSLGRVGTDPRLPRGLGKLEQLEVLSLEHAVDGAALVACASSLPSLRSLQFQSDGDLPDTFDSLRSIESLGVGTETAELPKSLRDLRNVERFSFHGPLAAIGPWLAAWERLTELRLEGPAKRPPRTVLPAAVFTLARCKRLTIARHRLAPLDDMLGAWRWLESLTLDTLALESFSPSLAELGLRELRLLGMKAAGTKTALRMWGRMQALETLVIGAPVAPEVSELRGFESLGSLTLDLSRLKLGYELASVMASIAKLPKLRHLTLTMPDHAGISGELASLHGLETLSLTNFDPYKTHVLRRILCNVAVR
ncbi:hypothetical protein AKJ09_09462 [Labilithrix luteola]|uniref:WGR domain-containing protein n=1 Tax=Labilithrix luteola TaxID=1391654 RepID=A0A0K1QAN2_9BACT|nr:hypothetical protein AKJ09_09462 [Labilithrix luteola]